MYASERWFRYGLRSHPPVGRLRAEPTQPALAAECHVIYGTFSKNLPLKGGVGVGSCTGSNYVDVTYTRVLSWRPVSVLRTGVQRLRCTPVYLLKILSLRGCLKNS